MPQIPQSFTAKARLQTGQTPREARAAYFAGPEAVKTPQLRPQQISLTTGMLEAPTPANQEGIVGQASRAFASTMMQVTHALSDKKSALEAKSVYYGFEEDRQKLQSWYFGLQGEEAVNSHDKFKKSIDSLAGEAFNKVDPRVKAKLAPMLLGARNQAFNNASVFATSQFKKWENDVRQQDMIQVGKGIRERLFMPDAEVFNYIQESAKMINFTDPAQKRAFYDTMLLKSIELLALPEDPDAVSDGRTGKAMLRYKAYDKALSPEAKVKADALIVNALARDERIAMAEQRQQESVRKLAKRQAGQLMVNDYVAFLKNGNYTFNSKRNQNYMTAGLITAAEYDAMEARYHKPEDSSSYDMAKYSGLLTRALTGDSIAGDILSSGLPGKVQKELIGVNARSENAALMSDIKNGSDRLKDFFITTGPLAAYKKTEEEQQYGTAMAEFSARMLDENRELPAQEILSEIIRKYDVNIKFEGLPPVAHFGKPRSLDTLEQAWNYVQENPDNWSEDIVKENVFTLSLYAHLIYKYGDASETNQKQIGPNRFAINPSVKR